MGQTQQPPAPNTPPVANAGGPYSAEEGQTIAFNGSGSYDPDGSIVSYEWNFGDGSTGNGETATHNYNEAGIYTVSLTVRDNEDAANTDSSTVEIIEVPTTPVNNPPVADAGGPYSAEGGQPVAFDGSGSYDPDPEGSIVSYEWDFGDGSSGTGVAPTHSYTDAGTYNVVLTVTDDKGATDTDTTTVDVTTAADSGASLRINSVEVTPNIRTAGRNTFVSGKAVVTILDNNGNPVEGATVSGYWSVSASDADSALTDSNGAVTVYSDELKYKTGIFTFTFTANGVSHTIPWDGNAVSGTASYTES